MGAIKQCHEALHAMGSPRVHTEIRIGTRTNREQSMADKVASVSRNSAPGEMASARHR